MFKSIDPNALQSRGEPRKVSPRSGVGSTFSVVSGSLAPVAGASLSVSGRQQSAAVTSAALTGVAGAARPQGYATDFGSYGMGVTSGGPFPPGGIGSGVPSPLYPSGVGGTVAAGAGAAAAVGGASGPMTFEQQSTLISMMQDSQMQMLTLQSRVQDVAREYSTYSNILKSKHDTEMNAVRNIRVS